MTERTDRHSNQDDERDRIAKALIAYLEGHPQAADTLDGIMSRWLPESGCRIGRAAVEQALAELVGIGLLSCSRLPQGVDLYALKTLSSTMRPH